MTELVWRLRVAVLWIFLGVAQATGMVMFLYRPETLREITRGELPAGVPDAAQTIAQGQMELALAVMVPLAMAFLTLVLSDRANRWASGTLGLLGAFTAFFLTLQAFGDPSDFLITATFFLVTLLLLWHVWKWPMPGKAGLATHEDRAVRH